VSANERVANNRALAWSACHDDRSRKRLPTHEQAQRCNRWKN
jgi:hypothetical protein